MSYLASPFRYAPTYDVGLNTGTPEVGATLRRPKNKKNPQEEKNPTRTPNEGNGEGTSSAARAGSVSSGIAANAGAAGGILAQQGSSARSMMAQQDNEPATSTNLSQSQFQTLIHPNPVSAPASPTKTTVAPAASSPGFWSQVGHVASGIGHDISSIGHNSVVHDIMNFGDPFSKSDTGVAGAVSAARTPSTVIEPSNVYSPMRNFPEVSSGRPSVVQGSVVGEGSNAIGSAGQRALPSSIYESPYRASLGRQFMGSGNGSAAGDSSPSFIDSIPNDISELFSAVG